MNGYLFVFNYSFSVENITVFATINPKLQIFMS